MVGLKRLDSEQNENKKDPSDEVMITAMNNYRPTLSHYDWLCVLFVPWTCGTLRLNGIQEFPWWRRLKERKHLGSDINMIVSFSKVHNRDLKQNKPVRKPKLQQKMTKKIEF